MVMIELLLEAISQDEVSFWLYYILMIVTYNQSSLVMIVDD